MADDMTNISIDEVDNWFEASEEPPSADVTNSTTVDPAEKYASSQLRVVRETKDYQLDYLQHALQPGRELIDISPAYQRRLRWNNEKKSLLIESFLLNIPVPPIFLFERDYNEYEVIDGRQRLDAISSFLSNSFALSGLEYWPELNKSRFSDLPTVLKKGLLRRSLPAVVLLAETSEISSDGLDVRRVLFDRLNTGGVSLNPQELRNALYPGPLNSMLNRLARTDIFTRIWDIPPYQPGEEHEPSEELLDNALFSTFADAELVLRFFAVGDAVKNERSGSLRKILDRYMAENASLDEAEVIRMEALFIECLERLHAIFGEDTFRLPSTGKLSRPLYDALMIALSEDSSAPIEEQADQIRADLKTALKENDTYDVLVGRGNTINAIHARVDLARKILRGN